MQHKHYIIQSLETIVHPFNGTSHHLFNDIEGLTELFGQFLVLPENAGLRERLETAIGELYSLPAAQSAQKTAALSNLVTAVEPYIKSIGRLRFSNNAARLALVEQASLKGLLEQGLLFNRIVWDSSKSGRNHDPAYWFQQDCLTAVAYSVWRLRNEMAHESLAYAPARIFEQSNQILCFLFWILDSVQNRTVLELAVCPYRKQLFHAADCLDPDYERYIPLEAALSVLPTVNEDVAVGAVDYCPSGPLQVYSLTQMVPQFVLVGAGGAGKTRTLRHVTAQIAREVLAGGAVGICLPIYLPAFSLLAGATVETALERLLDPLTSDALREALKRGRCFLFVDALNEVATQDYARVVQLLQSFLLAFPRCRLVIASRQEQYSGSLPLPVYQIQPLGPAEIQNILKFYASSERQGGQLFSRIQSDRRLLALFRTPLMSRLLCELPSDMRIPRSTGEMMAALFCKLIEREHSRGQTFPRLVVEAALGHCARLMHEKSSKTMAESDLLGEISGVTRHLDSGTSPARLLSLAIGCGILERDAPGQVRFFHESVLDYFLALSYRWEWTRGPSASNLMKHLPPSSTSTEILAGLLTDPDDLIRTIASTDLVLAARCYGS